MEQSREVKKLARELFPGGTLVSNGNRFHDTRQLVADSSTKTVFDGAVRADTLTARADILNRDGDGWNVIQVKSSFSDSRKLDDYMDGLAYSTIVLRRAGIAVKSSSLLLLSRAYRHGDPADKLFTLIDKSEDVEKRVKTRQARYRERRRAGSLSTLGRSSRRPEAQSW